jgi:hypothetical protein
MDKKGFLKAALFLALFTALAAGASAQITISGGLALSSMEVDGFSDLDSEIGFGGNVYVDYLLPISVPLSLGGEVGFDKATVKSEGVEVEGTAIPFLARVAYHFDFMANLDFYLVGKVGYVIGSADVMGESYSGFKGLGFGFDVGAAYYFTPRFGAFAEAGFDRYNLSKDISGMDIDVIFSRFFTIGVSTKF